MPEFVLSCRGRLFRQRARLLVLAARGRPDGRLYSEGMAWWVWLLVAVVGAETLTVLFLSGVRKVSRTWKTETRRLYADALRREDWRHRDAA